MYTLLKQEGTARRGDFKTVHGTVQMPAFMNVATCAAIKGGLSAYDLQNIHTQVMALSAVYLIMSRINEPGLDFRTIYTAAELIQRESSTEGD